MNRAQKIYDGFIISSHSRRYLDLIPNLALQDYQKDIDRIAKLRHNIIREHHNENFSIKIMKAQTDRLRQFISLKKSNRIILHMRGGLIIDQHEINDRLHPDGNVYEHMDDRIMNWIDCFIETTDNRDEKLITPSERSYLEKIINSQIELNRKAKMIEQETISKFIMSVDPYYEKEIILHETMQKINLLDRIDC